MLKHDYMILSITNGVRELPKHERSMDISPFWLIVGVSEARSVQSPDTGSKVSPLQSLTITEKWGNADAKYPLRYWNGSNLYFM